MAISSIIADTKSMEAKLYKKYKTTKFNSLKTINDIETLVHKKKSNEVSNLILLLH